MKLGKASGTLSLAILAALASNAAAAEEDRGFYVGGNYGWTAATIDDERIISSLASRGITVTNIEDFDRDNGFKVYAGYQFSQHFALEGGYVDLGEFGYRAQTLPPGTLTGHIELDGWNLDLVGSWPITDRFAAFARIGAIYADAQTSFVGTGAIFVLDPDPSKSAVNLKYGVGLEFDVSRALSLRLEAERHRVDDAVGNIGDIDMLSAGLVLRFGRGDPVVVAPLPTPGPDCSSLDDDRDGVNNCNDRCPGSAAGQAIGPDGCPTVVQIDLRGVNFDFDRDTLRPDAIAILDEAVSILGRYPQLRVEVGGHTDECGSDEYNQGLSERRARVVYDYLTSRGVDAGRMSGPSGYGESRPIVQTGDGYPECRNETNRRTELDVQN